MTKRIAFWSKTIGNFMSHGKGLTKDEVAFLHSLKEGDRLIMWDNSKKAEGTNNPTHSLSIWEPKDEQKSGNNSSSKSLLA